MAQINIPLLPQAPTQYTQSQINQLVTSLDQLILLLNSSYTPEQLRNEDEAFSWFITGGGGGQTDLSTVTTDISLLQKQVRMLMVTDG
jgi:hypothetical protein|tara:strand:+ start:6683 stop:6946 length:264 start_codon:yes stop_codon:yes gene_type:complete